MQYSLNTIIGDFVFDDKTQKLERAKSKIRLDSLPAEKTTEALLHLKNKKYFQEFYEKNIKLTKRAVKESVTDDQLIIQTIANINEVDKAANLFTKRLREWYGLYFPELSERITSHEKFVELICGKTKAALMSELKFKESMGAELEKRHTDEILLLAKQVQELWELRKKHETYLEALMKKYSPNLLELAGTTIGAKLIELGKGLKHLALLPASTIQMLGAEKALFRHIKTGSKSPKYGIIINHPLVQNSKKEEKGKAARMLADKLSLCARLDYFKCRFKANEYKKELEKKIEKWAY